MEQSLSPHRRFNPLIKSWVLVSPQRIYRPWDGQIETANPNHTPSTVVTDNSHANNPLQPNAIRSNNERNPDYQSTFVFTNDFPALLDTESTTIDNKTDRKSDDRFDFFQSQPAVGLCQVMCFHPSSSVTLASMSTDEVVHVIDNWIEIINRTSRQYEWIQIFENRGELMGSSNRHPHCQIWSTKYLPNIPTTKNDNCRYYFERYGSPMIHDYLNRELSIGEERIVCQNECWVCLVPYWAEWPFETMIIARRIDVRRMNDLKSEEIEKLALITQELLRKYNRLFNVEFPYSMGWFGAPTGSYLDKDMSHWTLHAVYYPPLLRSANVKKFFAGFELLCEIQRDLTPEKAAEMLRSIKI